MREEGDVVPTLFAAKTHNIQDRTGWKGSEEKETGRCSSIYTAQLDAKDGCMYSELHTFV